MAPRHTRPTRSVGVSASLGLGLAFLVGGCGDSTTTPPPPPVTVTVSVQTDEIIPTTTTQATAAVANASSQAVNWSSSDGSVASVNAAGVVRGVGPGTATLTATAQADPTASGTARVTVLDPCTAGVGDVVLPGTGDELQVTGDLEEGDCRIDGEAVLVDRWRLQIGADAGVSLIPDGAGFDAQVTLIDGGGNRTTAAAGFQRPLAAGSYVVEVAAAAGRSGSYALAVAQYDRCDVAVGDFAGADGESYAGDLTGLDCPVGGVRAHLHEVAFTEATALALRLETPGWEGQLFVTGPAVTDPFGGTPIAAASDGVPGPGAGLGAYLQPGSYRIWVVSESGAGLGPYTLTSRRGASMRASFAAPGGTDLGFGETAVLDVTVAAETDAPEAPAPRSLRLCVVDPTSTFTNTASLITAPDLPAGGRVQFVARGPECLGLGGIGEIALTLPNGIEDGASFSVRLPSTAAAPAAPVELQAIAAEDQSGADVSALVFDDDGETFAVAELDLASLPVLRPGDVTAPFTAHPTEAAYFRVVLPVSAGAPAAGGVVAGATSAVDESAKGDGAGAGMNTGPSIGAGAAGDRRSAPSGPPPTAPAVTMDGGSADVVIPTWRVFLESAPNIGDADLYLRRGAPPTAAASDCVGFTPSSDEACSVYSGGGESDWYAMVRSWNGGEVPGLTFGVEGPTQQVDGTDRIAWATGFADGGLYEGRGPAGTAVTTTRLSTGAYTVEFENFAVDAGAGAPGSEIVLTGRSAIPDEGEVGTCTPAWTQEGARLSITVQCFRLDGTPADMPFNVMAIGAGAIEAPMGYMWAPGAVQNGPPSPLYAWNAEGRSMSIEALDEGRRLRFGTPAPGGAAFVTVPYAASAVTCTTLADDPAQGSADIRCLTATGERGGAVAMMLGHGPRSDGRALGWARVDDPSAEGVITLGAGSSFNSTGGAVTSVRFSEGLWRLGFDGHGGVDRIGAVARIMGSDGGTCHNEVSLPDPVTGEAVVFVRCYDAAGAPADRPFSAVFIN